MLGNLAEAPRQWAPGLSNGTVSDVRRPGGQHGANLAGSGAERDFGHVIELIAMAAGQLSRLRDATASVRSTRHIGVVERTAKIGWMAAGEGVVLTVLTSTALEEGEWSAVPERDGHDEGDRR
ncbi:hypothetical protein AB8O38_08335 [Saccharomonospora xinjiangensis]|uniref:hypothetical protein n=1 Tax=Saccharomonospora xinjiangensis TaxID=75294 RepID=UPI00350FE3AB